MKVYHQPPINGQFAASIEALTRLDHQILYESYLMHYILLSMHISHPQNRQSTDLAMLHLYHLLFTIHFAKQETRGCDCMYIVSLLFVLLLFTYSYLFYQ